MLLVNVTIKDIYSELPIYFSCLLVSPLIRASDCHEKIKRGEKKSLDCGVNEEMVMDMWKGK